MTCILSRTTCGADFGTLCRLSCSGKRRGAFSEERESTERPRPAYMNRECVCRPPVSVFSPRFCRQPPRRRGSLRISLRPIAIKATRDRKKRNHRQILTGPPRASAVPAHRRRQYLEVPAQRWNVCDAIKVVRLQFRPVSDPRRHKQLARAKTQKQVHQTTPTNIPRKK